MKTNNERNTKNLSAHNFAAACLTSCRKLLAQLEKTKTAIAAEFREAFGAPEQLLHLALNEAEALAWQTEYPFLVFPALATEKAQAVANWQARQRSIRGEHFAYAFAA